KSTLAVHWAYRVAHRFPGGQLYVDLRGFSGGQPVEATEVVDRFLAALEVPVEQIPHQPSRAAKLRQLLATRPTLVLLDNAYNSEQVLPMLDYLSSCLVVVTSRRMLSGLRLRGAIGIPIPPMDHREARAWLADQTGARAAAEPGAVSDLTALCGGIPLALRGV